MDESTGRPLRDVYSVSLGVALVLAVEQVVDQHRAGIPVEGDAFLPFLAFVVTAFSLYHWAIRFVDLPSGDGHRRSPAAVVVALIVGATELLLVIALSTLVSRPEAFLNCLAALLAFEVLAGVALHASDAYGRASQFALRYLAVNGIAFALALCGAVAVAIADPQPVVAGVVAAVVAWARAAAFYRAGFDLLFGNGD